MTKHGKKKVLIGLYGLSRTFKQTSVLLFERIINPNKDKYDFDIIINTDFNAEVLTYGRQDNSNGVSCYKYNKLDDLYSDLYTCYNRENQLKEVIIYNKENTFFIHPFFLTFKRIQQILKKAYDSNKTYDIYIVMRLDMLITTTLDLNSVSNELVPLSGNFTRNYFLHNRDILDSFYGSYKPFMYWFYSLIQIFDSVVSKKQETINYFDKEPFCDNSIISYFNEKYNNIDKNNKNIIHSVVDKVKLLHTSCSILGKYHVNNEVIEFRLNDYYELHYDYLFKEIVYTIYIILQSEQFDLSEHRNLYYTIIR